MTWAGVSEHTRFLPCILGNVVVLGVIWRCRKNQSVEVQDPFGVVPLHHVVLLSFSLPHTLCALVRPNRILSRGVLSLAQYSSHPRDTFWWTFDANLDTSEPGPAF